MDIKQTIVDFRSRMLLPWQAPCNGERVYRDDYKLIDNFHYTARLITLRRTDRCHNERRIRKIIDETETDGRLKA